MEEEYKNYPFYDWVPKPLGIIFMIILFVPMITMSGVYSANSGEMMSGLGIQSEYIAFAGFCTSIGMAAFSPFFYDLVCIRREKMMCIVGFSILFILSFVCAQTDSLFDLYRSSRLLFYQVAIAFAVLGKFGKSYIYFIDGCMIDRSGCLGSLLCSFDDIGSCL